MPLASARDARSAARGRQEGDAVTEPGGIATLPMLPAHPADDTPTECPEAFQLSKDRRSVIRTIRLRDGSTQATHFALSRLHARTGATPRKLAELADAAFLRATEWPPLDAEATPVRIADIFCGCGLMTLGAWEACRALGRRLEPVYALDMNATALGVYKANFPTATLSEKRVEEVLDGALGTEPTDAERALLGRLGNVHLLVGGPPCQGHSNLNNHTRRDDPKNALYARMARFAELARPSHIIIENVSDVLHDRGRVVGTTVAHLSTLGYHVDHAIAEAAALGVAQRRRRHVLVASLTRRLDIGRVQTVYTRAERGVGWAIGDLRTRKRDTVFDGSGSPQAKTRKRIAYLFAHDLYDLPDRMRPVCHRSKDHSYKSVYGRMYWDEPAQTITSGFGCMGQGRYVHPKEQRTLTPHEAARLQFVPDFFRFDRVRRTALAEMIGNGVPTKLTYVLALELLR
jgi:DNA (cytosine-5)-methyltransferase 1